MLSKIDRGAMFMLLSALVAAFNGALTKTLTDDLSALEIVFFRSIVGMLFLLVMLKHTPTKLAGGEPFMLFLRGVLGFSAMILFFYTIATIPLGIAITLNETSPLFVSILAFFLLKERLSPRAIIALFIGFGGLLLITKPVGLTLGYEYFLGVLGGFLAASAYTTIKQIKHIYDARTIVLSFTITGTLLPLLLFFIAPYITPPEPIAFLFAEFVMPSTIKTWSLILLIGIIATLSQGLLTKAYSLSKAGIIGIVSYTNIPFAIGFGYMLGDAFPDFWTFCGIGLIALGGLLVKKG
ncbi:MAG: DMT family transporter [Sulfurimonas sp.]|jgi:drug/metabolite transporter (DMT)-like permease|nr:DMT family transporter [Sulfurimonas sp.]